MARAEGRIRSYRLATGTNVRIGCCEFGVPVRLGGAGPGWRASGAETIGTALGARRGADSGMAQLVHNYAHLAPERHCHLADVGGSQSALIGVAVVTDCVRLSASLSLRV